MAANARAQAAHHHGSPGSEARTSGSWCGAGAWELATLKPGEPGTSRSIQGTKTCVAGNTCWIELRTRLRIQVARPRRLCEDHDDDDDGGDGDEL